MEIWSKKWQIKRRKLPTWKWWIVTFGWRISNKEIAAVQTSAQGPVPPRPGIDSEVVYWIQGMVESLTAKPYMGPVQQFWGYGQTGILCLPLQEKLVLRAWLALCHKYLPLCSRITLGSRATKSGATENQEWGDGVGWQEWGDRVGRPKILYFQFPQQCSVLRTLMQLRQNIVPLSRIRVPLSMRGRTMNSRSSLRTIQLLVTVTKEWKIPSMRKSFSARKVKRTHPKVLPEGTSSSRSRLMLVSSDCLRILVNR